MEPEDLVLHLSQRAAFSPERMTKLDAFRTERVLVGLNCFEPGQEQRVHTHQDADKFYFVVSGKARFVVGAAVREAGAGDLVLAPAGVSHGVAGALERTVVLVAMAPPPGA